RHDRTSTDEGPLADRHPREDHRPGPEAGSPSHARRRYRPVGVGLQRAIGAAGPREQVVGEADMVTDEDFVLYRDPLTDERVAGDLAALPHHRVFLDLDERPDACAVADRAAIEVDEAEDLDVTAQLHVGSDAVERFHRLQERRVAPALQRYRGG